MNGCEFSSWKISFVTCEMVVVLAVAFFIGGCNWKNAWKCFSDASRRAWMFSVAEVQKRTFVRNFLLKEEKLNKDRQQSKTRCFVLCWSKRVRSDLCES